MKKYRKLTNRIALKIISCMYYFMYIMKHKWHVFVGCCRVSLYWRGIIHDMSKLRPSEFFPYAEHYFGEKRKGIYTTKDKNFEFAWLLHQKRNKHHWQYWVLRKNSGGVILFDMPPAYRGEMLCDWYGAEKAKTGDGRGSIVQFYFENKKTMQLHPHTKDWIEAQIKHELSYVTK